MNYSSNLVHDFYPLNIGF